MLFNSLHFLIFFPAVLLVYYIVPKKLRYIWLLLASYYFYMSWNATYALLIAASTLTTFLSGVLISRVRSADEKKLRQKKKAVVAASFVFNLGILFFFKYFDFFIDNINLLISDTGLALLNNPFDIILPVGISFYTFQALSYTVDVYRGEVPAEKNILKYALFVSFFPQLVAGPIERSKNLLEQVNNIPEISRFQTGRMARGFVMMLWGFFMKMVIADRLSVFADKIFTNYWTYDSVALVAGAVVFAVQIYCDFASYSTIAIGAAKVLGFELMENFDTPYFAVSIKDFWRRWHISLSTWFRDYLYIPLGGNRKGKARKYFNLALTFIVSGLWHGASWTYVFWGALHGGYQIVGEVLSPYRNRLLDELKVKRDSLSFKLGQVIVCFVLTDFAWIFFRSATIADAFSYIGRIFTKPDIWSVFNGSLFKYGLNRVEMGILMISVLILFAVDLIKYKRRERLDAFLFEQNSWFRWAVVLTLLFVVIIFGAYGAKYDPQAFIYFQF